MHSSGMQLQICPSISYIIATRIWTIELEQDQRLFHHLRRFEVDRELGVFVWYVIWFVRTKFRIRGCSEDYCWLWFLPSQIKRLD